MLNRVAIQEQKRQVHKRFKIGLIGLGGLLLFAVIVLELLLSLPRWISALLLIIVALTFLTAWIWKSPVAEETFLHNRKEVELFQTQSGDYTSLSEEERCRQLVQRII